MVIQDLVLWGAFGLYVVNLVIGITAQLKLYHFGKVHHYIYFFVVVASIAAMVVHFHPALLLTLISLILMPKSKPWTWKHPACAAVGFLGFLFALFFQIP
jgi:hypothetical protein